ncbi:MAG TPA: 50S ribosomal protein L9 [Acidobacteriota bacterium]|jgi:large subunit ribosomal protein L9|nr:50S ribosomal protein L9 [Acidobacteriota bacterium]HNT16770.1 50S ribosomal protein L9 [Acidobacteriota bacterium]HPA26904.1 50S ribosomal protein L9 [Acidobacteriota bacterium]HQO20022.1 50S ribosomal protein L9 [Acidobacteriota bacterium]HQQ45827.1 50S ribosomal protein L9 [Acidobacteriota bacterium]
MKIILKDTVENLGNRGAVVEVKDGFARNFLIPKGLAMKFTQGALKLLQQEHRMYEAKQVKEKEDAQEMAEKLSAVELVVQKRSGDQDLLYGSVTPTDIADLLEEKGFKIDKRKILLHEPIKRLGEFEIRIRLHQEVVPVVKLTVTKEE